MSAVDVSGLEFGYDATPVLHGVSVAAQRGTLLCVIGPSGCGKTTLLRLIAGFERPGAGAVHIGGALVADRSTSVPPDRRRVGIVPQEGALFPHLTLAANVGFGLPRRAPGRAERIAELMALTGLEGLGDRYPRQLSGGQQQRVALARALAPRPEVVLLDEPFASLDPTTRVAVRRSVREILAAEGATAVLVTHDREEALSMADQVAVLVDGRVAQTGSPFDVYDAPADARVATLLGEVSLLPVLARHGASVDTALGRLPLADSADRGTDEAGRVLLRPEQIVVHADGMPAVVLDVDFVGPTARAAVRLDDGTPLLTTLVGARPRAGDTLRLGVAGPVHVVP